MKTNPPLRPYAPAKSKPATAPPDPDEPQRPLGWRIFLGVLKWSFRLGMFALLMVGAALGGAYTAIKQNFEHLADVTKLESYAPVESTEILDANGHLLYKLYGEENRKVVPLKEIPEQVQQAVISSEDSRFYEHTGVDPVGLMRALRFNVNKQSNVQGGSTITQQVVKNLFLTPERTFQRKLAEMWLAMDIERHYSKSQILELYLNQIYWGHNAYGIEAAAETYFGKPVSKLNLAEGALLAGILTGPELYSPYRDPEAAKKRQEMTLNRMAEVGFISAENAKQARTVKLKYPGIHAGAMKYPYFTSYVLAILKQNYGESLSFKQGMRVYTTLDADLQVHAEKMLAEHVRRHKGERVGQAAMVTIDNQTGYVKAIVGGTGYTRTNQFNRAWQAQRQPGSSFKPFVYLTAFARGFQPGHIMVDEPIQYRFGSYVWRPRNYGGGHSGAMTLQSALEHSNNIIAVKLGERVGNANVIETAHRLGIRSPLRNVLSLALGPNEVTPLEMASAYSSMAREGTYLEPTPILRIEDRFGNLIEDNRNRQPEPVYSNEACSTLIQVMKGVIERGTAYEARIGRPAAGKTGTTSDHKDAWFVGFTPQLTTAVWVGNDKPVEMYGYATGGHISAPLWATFMSYAHRKLPIKDFPVIKRQAVPELSKKPIDAPDADSGFTPSYERLNSRQDKQGNPNDPFLLDPSNLPMVAPFSDPQSTDANRGLDPQLNTPAMQMPSVDDGDSFNKPPTQSHQDGVDRVPSLPNRPQTKSLGDEPPMLNGGETPPPGEQPATATQPRKEKVISDLDKLLEDLNRMPGPGKKPR